MSSRDTESHGGGTRKQTLRDVTSVLAFSLAARLLLFSGFGLGDDLTYAESVHQIITTGYPNPAEPNLFLLRPVFLEAIATSVKWFGWSEFAFVLPVLVASLVGITSVYFLGLAIHGRVAALFAALALSLAPLDMVNSTTLTNDIVGSAFLGVGSLLAFAAFRAGSFRPLLLAAVSGLVFGMSTSVKTSFVVAAAPLVMCVAWEVWRNRGTWRIGVSVAAGYATAQLVLGLFCLLKFGNAFAPLDVELEFNYGAMERHYSPEMLGNTLLYYPRMIAGLRPAGLYGHEIFPVGWFYLLAILSSLTAPFLNIRSSWRPLVFFVFLMLALEFWPLRLEPYYIPIHRLPRFLHIAAIPEALLIGVAVAEMLKQKTEWKVAAVLAFTVYAVTSFRVSSAASAHHNDSMRDMRLIAETLRYSHGLIVSDIEARTYLLFADRFRSPNRFLLNPATHVPSGSLVVVGGSRRPEFGSRVAFPEEAVPTTWTEVANFGGAETPWRLTPARIYAVGNAQAQ